MLYVFDDNRSGHCDQRYKCSKNSRDTQNALQVRYFWDLKVSLTKIRQKTYEKNFSHRVKF